MNARVTVPEADLAQAQREAGWTTTRIRVVAVLFNSGLSASQCACLIGGATRNAVIGIIHREGLGDQSRMLPRGSNGLATGQRQRPKRDRPAPAARISRPRQSKPGEPPPPHVQDAAISLEQRRSLVELTDNCCHWPVGDPSQPDFFFCGAVVTQPDRDRPRPYCPSHMRRAHDPARGSRARPGVHRGVGDARL